MNWKFWKRSLPHTLADLKHLSADGTITAHLCGPDRLVRHEMHSHTDGHKFPADITYGGKTYIFTGADAAGVLIYIESYP